MSCLSAYSRIWNTEERYYLRISRETEPMVWINIYKRKFIIRIGSHDYGSCKGSQSASWRTRKADDVIQLESKGLRTKGTNGVSLSPSSEAQVFRGPTGKILVWVWRLKNQNHQCLRAENGLPSSRKDNIFYFSLSFCST